MSIATTHLLSFAAAQRADNNVLHTKKDINAHTLRLKLYPPILWRNKPVLQIYLKIIKHKQAKCCIKQTILTTNKTFNVLGHRRVSAVVCVL